MKCQEAFILISGKLDGELSPDQERELNKHLETCPVCRKEYEELLHLKEVTSNMRFTDLPDRYWAGYWNGVYNRLERGIGWIFLSIGAMIVLGFVGWEFLQNFFLNPHEPLLLRFGVGIGLIGVIILLVSILRERLFARKHERYEEVER
jgi:predicted anti-sigma-YlaC factor YlaD